MDRYLFILGKNWELALAELDGILRTTRYQGQILEYSPCAAVVEFVQGELDEDQLSDLNIRLGSIQKIGKYLDYAERDVIENAFPVEIEENRPGVFGGRRILDRLISDVLTDLFPQPKGEKLFIAVSIYPERFKDDYYKQILIKHMLPYVNSQFNAVMKQRGANQAVYYKYPLEKIEKGTLNPIFPHHYYRYQLYESDRAELLCCLMPTGMYFAHTVAAVDSNLQKQLDENRQKHDFKQTIPPKFAKTLLSLLGLEPSKDSYKIWDPFCGTGTILQYALFQGLEFYGSDIDPQQVSDSKENMIFTSQALGISLNKKNLEKRLFSADIRIFPPRISANSIDGIATEPVLLPFFRQHPTSKEYQVLLDSQVTPLYEALFKTGQFVLKTGKRIALVAPFLRGSMNDSIRIPLEEIAEKYGFKSIRLLQANRIPQVEENENEVDLTARPKYIRDIGSKHIGREFHLFVKD